MASNENTLQSFPCRISGCTKEFSTQQSLHQHQEEQHGGQEEARPQDLGARQTQEGSPSLALNAPSSNQLARSSLQTVGQQNMPRASNTPPGRTPSPSATLQNPFLPNPTNPVIFLYTHGTGPGAIPRTSRSDSFSDRSSEDGDNFMVVVRQ